MSGFVSDIRVAARRLLATPMFTAFAVLSLALGVGVTTAVYSVIASIFLKDPGVRDPARVAVVAAPSNGRLAQAWLSEPDFRDLRAAQRSFSTLSASILMFPAISSPQITERLPAEAVDGSYFTTLGVATAAGRALGDADDAAGQRVVVLSHWFWRARFGADPAIVGREIRLAGQPFEIVGVAASSFDGMVGGPLATTLWIPLRTAPLLEPDAGPVKAPPRDRPELATFGQLVTFGRLSPSATVATASAELSTIAATLDTSVPLRAGQKLGPPAKRRWVAQSFADTGDNSFRRIGMVLVALVALVLVVACTNLANLVMARGTARRQEMTIRHALGAARWRLVREQCAESVLLAVAGGVAAGAVFQAVRAVAAGDVTITLPFGGRLVFAIRPVLDPAAFAVAAGALALALAVFGLEPAIQLTRSLDLRGTLAEGDAGPSRSRRQRRLVRWQVAIAAGYFIVATMFVKYTFAEARHDPGIDLDRIAVAVLNVQDRSWDDARVRRAVDRAVADLRNDRAVESVSVSTGLPFGARALRLSVAAAGDGGAKTQEGTSPATGVAATPSIFRTIGVTILRGRAFDDRDGAPPVAVVSEYTARKLFGTADAVGRQLLVGDAVLRSVTATVVGVARDTDVRSMFGDPAPVVYVPLEQRFDRHLAIAARAAGDPAKTVAALQAALRRADPDLALDAIGTGRSALAGLFVFLRVMGLSALALGALTLMLAMAGLFGIQSHAVAARTKEIGVRISFGASPRQIQWMVLRDGCLPVVDGLALGVCVGLAGRFIARAYLELDMAIVDPWMVVVVPVPVVLAAVCACYLPAQRAASVDPMIALRHL